MNQSSAIQISTAMDTNNVAATTTETVAKINAFSREIRVAVKDEKGNVIKNDDGSTKVRIEHRTFIAVNDLPAISIDQVDFGQATGEIVMVDESFGASFVNSVVKSALRTEFTYALEDEYLSHLAIDIPSHVIMERLKFYKMMNA